MNHLVIFLHIFSLIIGTWAIIFTYQFYKIYKKVFIRAFTFYILFFNLILLLDLAIKYIFTNLTTYEPSKFNDLVVYFISPFKLLLTITAVFWFIILIIKVQEIQTIRFAKKVSLFGIISILVIHATGIIIYFQNSSFKFISNADKLTDIIFILLILIVLIDLLIRRRFKNIPKKQAAINIIAYSYLTIYCVPYMKVFLPDNFIYYLSTILFILINFFPLYWFKYILTQYYLRDVLFSESDNILSEISKKYMISKREGEIMELILQGKSNNEIGETLFISFHTVKNHIYSLYNKMGIKSRAQLISFVLNLNNNKLN